MGDERLALGAVVAGVEEAEDALAFVEDLAVELDEDAGPAGGDAEDVGEGVLVVRLADAPVPGLADGVRGQRGIGPYTGDVVGFGGVDPGEADGEVRRRIAAELEEVRAGAAGHVNLDGAAPGPWTRPLMTRNRPRHQRPALESAHVFELLTPLWQIGVARDPLSIAGEVAMVINHPVVVGAFLRRAASSGRNQ